MTERNGNRCTEKGIKLKAKHQATYEKWWLGKFIETNYYKNYPESEEFISGVVKEVTYIGNSVSGVVELILEDGYKYLVSASGSSFRPTKSDVKCID